MAKTLFSSEIDIRIIFCMVGMAISKVRMIYDFQKKYDLDVKFSFMMLSKGNQNFHFCHKIWKEYLEWYTSALGIP